MTGETNGIDDDAAVEDDPSLAQSASEYQRKIRWYLVTSIPYLVVLGVADWLLPINWWWYRGALVATAVSLCFVALTTRLTVAAATREATTVALVLIWSSVVSIAISGVTLSLTTIAGGLVLTERFGVYLMGAPLALGTLLVLVAGLVLFFFRLRFRAAYGFTEVVVGMALGSYRFTNDLFKHTAEMKVDWNTINITLGVVSAGVYLVVRGLDNVHQSWSKDPLVERLRSMYRTVRKLLPKS